MVDPTTKHGSPEPYGYVREDHFTRKLTNMRSGVVNHFTRKQQQRLNQVRYANIPIEVVEDWEKRAFLDEPTGLISGGMLRRKLEYEVQRSKRYRRPMALLALKIDQHGELQRLLSPMVTDDLFALLAEVIQNNIRDIDLAGRLDHDTIGIMCIETNMEGAVKLAQRLIEEVYSIKPNPIFGNRKLTATIGISTIPRISSSVHDLIEASVESAKSGMVNGGNRIVRKVAEVA